MRKIVYALLALVTFASCQVEELVAPEVEATTDTEYAVYSVGMEADLETRTSLSQTRKIFWSEGDSLNIFFGANNDKKQAMWLVDGQGTPDGYFNGPYILSPNVENVHQTVVVYPYNKNNTCVKNEDETYTIATVVPSVQKYAPASFANGAYPMIGVSKNAGEMFLQTKNVLSAINFEMKGTKTISKIVLSSKDFALAGPATVAASYGNDPVVTIDEATGIKSVELVCDGGVTLNKDEFTKFYLTFAPCTGSLTIAIYDTEGGYTVRELPSREYVRNGFVRFGHEYTGENSVANDLVNAFKKGGNYTLPVDVTVDVQLPLTDKTLYLDLNGNTLNLGGTQSATQGHIKTTRGHLYISNGTITGKQNYMFVTSALNGNANNLSLTLDKVNIVCTGGVAVFGFPGETNMKLTDVNIKSTKTIFRAFKDGSKGRIVIDGGRFESTSAIFQGQSGDFTIPVTFNGDCRFSDKSYTLVRWNEIEDATCKYVPESFIVFIGETGYYSLSDAIKAAKDGDTIVLKNGTYEGLFYVDGKSVTIKAENAGQATINGKLAIAASGKTVNVEGIVFENSYAGSVNVGHQYLDKTGKYCIGLYCASVNVDNCTFNLATDGGINFYAINAPDRCTVTNCTFNANGFRPIISKANLTVDNCTFNDQNKYALQVWGNQNTGDESVVFTNNEIVNAGKTSGVSNGLLSYVSISGSYAISNVAFTIQDNTPGYHFIYDNKANVKITEISFNGKTIVPEQCVSIAGVSDTKEVLNYEDVCVAFANGQGFVTLTDALENTTGDVEITVKAGEYTLPSQLNPTSENRTVTVKGAGVEATNIEGTKVANSNNPGNFAHGANLKFENLTFTTANNGYNGGFGHAASVEFKNCKIVGQYYAHSGAYHKFENCTIDPLNGYLYTYASDCDFINCDFAASQGKALQVYEDASNGENVVNIKGCRFVAAKQAATWDGKPVTGIDINSNGNTKFVVNIDDCTTTGFPTGLNSGSDLWNVKNVNGNISVYVDGKLMVGTVAQLQKALDNDATAVYFSQDITGNVKVTQKADVNVVIDGNGKKFAGIMTTFGNGRQSGAETLTIKNINFEAANGADACIVSPDRSVYVKYSYSHNVTVEACTFTDPDGGVNCAAVRQNDGGDKNWTITGCTVDNTMHSILQVNNVEGKLKVNDCEVASKNGANLNSCTNVEMNGCQFDVKGYAVRFGVNSGGNLGTPKTYTIENSTLKSECNDGDAVIIFRASAVDATLNLVNTTLLGTTEISGATSATTINR